MFSLKLQTKVLAGLAAVVLTTLVAGGLVAFLDFRDAYRTVTLAHIGFVAKATRSAIEDGMSLGMALPEFRQTQDIISRERARNPGIKAIVVFDAGGRVVFSTDAGEIGDRLPLLPGAAPGSGMPGSGIWSADDGPLLLAGIGLENDLGEVVGGVLIRHAADAMTAVLERAAAALGGLAVLILAVTLPMAALGIRLAFRPVMAALDGMTRGLRARVAGRAPPAPVPARALPVWHDYVRFEAQVLAVERRIAEHGAEVERLDETA